MGGLFMCLGNDEVMDSAALVTISTRNGSKISPGVWEIVFGGNNMCCTNIVSAEPTQISVPYAFDNVREPYNILRVTELGDGGAWTTITIPAGRYTGVDLAAIVNLELANAGITTLTLAFSESTVLESTKPAFTWTSTLVKGGTGEHTIDPTSPLHNYVGLPSVYLSSGNYEVHSLMPVDLSLPNLEYACRQVHVISEKLGHSTLVHSQQPPSPLDCVATIPIDVPYLGYQVWVPSDRSDYLNGNLDNVKLDTVRIQILDQDLNPLDLPDNYHIEIIWRVNHLDGSAGQRIQMTARN